MSDPAAPSARNREVGWATDAAKAAQEYQDADDAVLMLGPNADPDEEVAALHRRREARHDMRSKLYDWRMNTLAALAPPTPQTPKEGRMSGRRLGQPDRVSGEAMMKPTPKEDDGG